MFVSLSTCREHHRLRDAEVKSRAIVVSPRVVRWLYDVTRLYVIWKSPMTSHAHIPTASTLYVTPATLHVPCVLRLFGHTPRHPIRMRNVLSPDVQCSLPDVFSHLETVTFLSVTTSYVSPRHHVRFRRRPLSPTSYVCYPRRCVGDWTAQALTCNRRKTRQQPNSVSCGHVSVSTPNLNSSNSSSE